MKAQDARILTLLKKQLKQITNLRMRRSTSPQSVDVGCHKPGYVDKVFHLSATRPWTTDCLSNLNLNLGMKWSAEKTATETRRDLQEVIFMTAMVRLHGYDKLQHALLLKELNLGVTDEVRFLQHLGIVQ
jgi:hypothetical protein